MWHYMIGCSCNIFFYNDSILKLNSNRDLKISKDWCVVKFTCFKMHSDTHTYITSISLLNSDESDSCYLMNT